MKILGVPIETLSRQEILARVSMFLDESKFHQIVTVNPEFLLEAEKNQGFRQVLLEADLRIADGFGIVLAGWLQGECVHRFPGTDLMEEILHVAEQKKLSVFLAVNKNGLSSFEETRVAILKKYPELCIDGNEYDLRINNPSILNSQFSIFFCNFGAPAQEFFLANLKNNSGNARLAMGVGGSFDYLTGKQKRAPKWLGSIGLEWFWRLLSQPRRFPRIWKASVVFPFRVFFATIKK